MHIYFLFNKNFATTCTSTFVFLAKFKTKKPLRVAIIWNQIYISIYTVYIFSDPVPLIINSHMTGDGFFFVLYVAIVKIKHKHQTCTGLSSFSSHAALTLTNIMSANQEARHIIN